MAVEFADGAESKAVDHPGPDAKLTTFSTLTGERDLPVLHCDTFQLSVDQDEPTGPTYIALAMRYGNGGLYVSYDIDDAETLIAGLQKAVKEMKRAQS